MILAVDTETTGTDFFHGCRPFLFTACNGEEVFWESGEVDPYSREVTWKQDALDRIQKLLDSATKLIFHNAQFDMRALEFIGILIDHLWDKVEDTNIAAHALHSAHYTNEEGEKGSKKRQNVGRRLGLKDLCMEYFGWPDDDEKDLDRAVQAERLRVKSLGYAIAKAGHPHFPAAKKQTKWFKMDMWLCPKECLKYALLDAERTFILWAAFEEALYNEGLYNGYKLRRNLLPICYDITSEGIYVDEKGLRKYIKSLDTKMKLIYKYVQRLLGVNHIIDLNKPDIISTLLHQVLKIPIDYRTATERAATNKEALGNYTKKYKSKGLNAYMKWKKWETKKRYATKYIHHLDANSRMHSILIITGTVGTRQSSADPNQQNFDPITARYLGPPPGYVWLDTDFSNLEMRIWAYAVGNKKLIGLFEAGVLFHEYVMEKTRPLEYARYIKDRHDNNLKALYKKTKNGNFSIVYGGSEDKADRTYGLAGCYRKIVGEFPEIEPYTKKMIQEVFLNQQNELMPSIYTTHGYRLDVPVSEAFVACNRKVQGDAGIVMTKAMIAVARNPRYKSTNSHMIMQVHDSNKIQIPFHDGIRSTCYSFIESMESAAVDKLGRFPMDYELKFNKADKHRRFELK